MESKDIEVTNAGLDKLELKFDGAIPEIKNYPPIAEMFVVNFSALVTKEQLHKLLVGMKQHKMVVEPEMGR